MFLIDVKVSEDNFNDFVRRGEEGVEQTVDAGGIGARVIGAAECTTLLAIRRREADTGTTWRQM